MDEILNDLDYALKCTWRTGSYFHLEKITPTQRMLLSLLNRLNLTCTGVKALLPMVDENPDLEYSIGLVLRTHLLDYLIAQKAFDIFEDKRDEQALLGFCNKVLADGFNSAFKFLRDLKSAGLKSDLEYDLALKNMADKYPQYLEPYHNDKKSPAIKFGGQLGGSNLFRQLAQGSAKLHYTWIYDIYSWYSKYEHFSALTEEISMVPIEKKIKIINKVIGTFLMQNALLLSLLARTKKDENLDKWEIEAWEYLNANHTKYQ